jgi:NADPH-dependent glutamate synthase beta subunit-like oxidoreductase
MQKPFAITLDVGSSLVNHTGSWRNSRPVYVSRKPPCNHQCPAGENIQAWLFHAESGDYEQAWRKLVEDNPFPATMGRVCYHTCEGACNRAKIDEAVGINSVEGFLGDQAIARGWQFPAAKTQSGKKVLVVGAGPSGLSAAYHLARLGHAVTVHEAGPMPGGMMRFGIPKYRLPRQVLDAEVQRIVDMGVTIAYNTKVSNVLESRQAGGFDAVFLAVGAHIAKRAFIPAGDSAKVLDAVAVLRSMEGEDKPMLGRRVVVYGGGNTAIDVARTAKRLGASEAIIVYRRNREKMPAHDFEVEEALQEGVMIKWLSTIKQAGESSITVEKMALDDKGFPQPTGEFETLEADSVVLALGQDVDLSLIEGVPGLAVGRRRCAGRRADDDGPRRHLCRWRHGSRRTQRDGCDRPWQESRAQHRRLAARRKLPGARQERTGQLRQAQPVVLQRRAEDRSPPCWTSFDASQPSRRCRVAWTSPTPCSRRDAACRAATVSSVTTVMGSVRTMRSSSTDPARGSTSTWTTARAVESVCPSVRAVPSRWCPKAPESVLRDARRFFFRDRQAITLKTEGGPASGRRRSILPQPA